MFIYAKIYISVRKMKPQASHSWLSININVVPNTSVMFAHLGGIPNCVKGKCVNMKFNQHTKWNVGQFQMLLGNNKLLYLMNQH